jgi:hypothetical protein
MQNTKIVADRDIIEQDEPATSMGWTPTDLHRCQGLSALPVGTPWHPILPESYSLCQRTPQKYSTEMSSRQLAQDIIFLVRRRTRERFRGVYLWSQHLAGPFEISPARCSQASPSPWWPSERDRNRTEVSVLQHLPDSENGASEFRLLQRHPRAILAIRK